ncbi:cupin domain-containing protein [Vibrio sp. Sgm 5]|uniref:cupin domain-containing protein n=1 Tax=Vibrio sp. Sgm 5 TaxID=2994387 RepID=UPI0022488CCC|nr:cupin domain-containing protein [Vibrio sp. Sgm 5]MCX2789535.1 cupin domain-containing protein [Vibrio sp. Sgm 5]
MNRLIGLLSTTVLSFNVIAGGCPIGMEGSTQFTPPTKKSGEIYVDIKAEVKLDDQAIAAEGWKYRTRTITFSPGAVVPVHSHDDRPEMAMMKHGEVTIYETNCKVPYVMKEGDVYHNELGISHWAVNDTDDFAVMYVTDLVKTESFPINK